MIRARLATADPQGAVPVVKTGTDSVGEADVRRATGRVRAHATGDRGRPHAHEIPDLT